MRITARLATVGTLAAILAQDRPAGDLVLTPRMHHLRIGDVREWSDFPAAAEGAALVLPFDATANRGERTLRLRHRDLKGAWRVQVNGQDVARLLPEDADTVSFWPIPAGTLRNGTNELRVDGTAAAADDVFVGEIGVLDRPRTDVLAEASVDITVREAPSGLAVPSRITVTDARGVLMSLGNVSDAAHAVRPGVVYSATGRARLELPAGSYVIHAGRGFEYGVDRTTVSVANRGTASRSLTIRREVDTTGWAAMDTHVHTGTYAKHGDAAIEERMVTLAGEGIELPVSTEHNTRVDFLARARAAGVDRTFTPILGTEVTTPRLGHFNVFPVPPAGPDIDHRAAGWNELRASIDAAAPQAVIVLNHARDEHGGFRPFDPARHVGVAGEDRDGWPLPANAMEIVNSGAVLRDALALTHDWMGLLNRGLRVAPVGSSDSHDVTRYIVGQGRTYVRADDRRPGAIDVPSVMDAVRRGEVMVSYGLLAEVDVAGQGPGALVAAHGELPVRVRVKGPGWTRATRVALYVNGLPVRDEAIAGGDKAGLKWEKTWRLPAPGHDVHVVAVATGPGVTAPYWPTAKPYQPTSPDFAPYVLGVSGAVFIDADGNGAFDSALTYARRELDAGFDPRRLASRLAGYDAAVATQAASLLFARDPAAFEATVDALIERAPAPVAAGLRAYVDARRAAR